MNDIEKLDALGREYGICLYSVHQCGSGWGAQWVSDDADNPGLPRCLEHYPTITEMVKAETERIKALVEVKQSTPIPAYPV